ncbi:MAG: glucose-1-phosphate adenylyltransferase subunit GlgD [Anaerolineaceae bacterium]|nr:MAG: glucose-1-phosphate adenylyltransferase subunit GlgD [Anaerolineaceae bacterium]
MIDTMGLILSDDVHISSLTEKRSISALPFAGRYRLIDFVLSNMVNAGITNVGVILKHNYSSLMDHLGSGKEWDLNRKNGGLHILPPYIARNVPGMSEGSIELIASAFSYLSKSKQKYIILTKGNTVFNIDFDEVMEFHLINKADITMVYYEEDNASEGITNHTFLSVDDDNRVTGIEVRPRRPKTNKIFMYIILIEKAYLQYLVDEAVARGEQDIVKDILIKRLSSLNICGYRFDGYVGNIDSIQSYYNKSMCMLNEKVRKEIFNPNRPIYTKIKDQAPTRYSNYASVSNCLIADGCTIEGQVKNSIIFRGVHIGKGSRVSNSIVMQDSVIQSGCELDYMVMDKEVIVREHGKLIGDSRHPIIISKGEIV